jgi:hypothetical protein
MSFRAFLVPFQALVSEPLYPGWGWMSQCRHARWQDIWQVMSLDGLWIQYTQADRVIHMKDMDID